MCLSPGKLGDGQLHESYLLLPVSGGQGTLLPPRQPCFCRAMRGSPPLRALCLGIGCREMGVAELAGSLHVAAWCKLRHHTPPSKARETQPAWGHPVPAVYNY